ncbi:MAG: hypothetical protein ACREVQ_06215 [Burkholderiales bacterium]
MTNKALATALIAALGVLPAALLHAQSEASKAPAMKLEQGKASAQKPDAKPMKTASAGGKHPIHINDDARHCLDLPSTAEIVKCAEPYRY